jgi:hypothetical protein
LTSSSAERLDALLSALEKLPPSRGKFVGPST